MSSNLVSLANHFFPEVVRDVLKDYPSVRNEVAAYMETPVFDASYRPQEVNLYFDDCWVASWSREGQVAQIPNLQLPSTSRPEVVELEVDGEPGLILVLGVEVLNRIEKIPGHELWLLEKQQAA
ncbi:hypothetical protein H6F74_28205 [Trichocoleus sp. FACHB-90]|uniref:hypothetical protein n=1 Tax=Cyanophyceae TaxID=3028117 RepID=UPI001688FE50|nr:hypothetical protein [Trichocoleus sp. FACHB-90]MBD1930078.1 hypothetical protein [Trichocoleus sp. FACHB-90]